MMIALVGLNANAAMYLVGNAPFGDGWEPSKGVEMADNGDGTYTFAATVNGAVYFVFASGLDSSWDVFNGQLRYGPTGGSDQEITAGQWTDTQLQGNGSGSYKFTGTGDEYTVTFDSNTNRFKIDGEVGDITFNTLTVAGSSAALFGTTWDPSNADNDMTLVNGLYTWEKKNVELTAGAVEFKVVADHDSNYGLAWPSENYHVAIAKHGYYDVTITFDASTNTVNCVANMIEEIIDTEDPVYTVTGSSAALFGAEWNEALLLEDNEMTKGQDGIYTWTKNNVALTAGNIEFKVVLGHAWGVQYPESNYVATIDQNGNYDVTITFDPATTNITFTATLLEETEDFYIVAGAPKKIFGEEWNPMYEANAMTLVEGLYTWTKDSVELAANDFIEFKVVKNNSWATSWPENNYEHTIAADGLYNLVITLNPETGEVVFTPTLLGGEVPPVEITVYTVVGPEAIFGSNWDATDENNDMTLAEGVYTWTKQDVELAAGNFGFKVVGNHDYAVYEWPMGFDNNWVANVEEAGYYTIEITFDPEAEDSLRIACNLTKTGDIEPVHYDGDVYVLGGVNGNSWATNVGVLMNRNAETNIYTLTINCDGSEYTDSLGVSYNYFSFTKMLAEEADNWDGIAPYRFGADSDGDFWVTEEVLGKNIALQNGGQSLRVPAGKWNLTLSVDEMWLVITTATVPGDINKDGKRTIADVTALISALMTNNFTETDNFDPAAADMDGDTFVKINDVTALIGILMGN
jgi:hypothetical protein